MTAKLVRSTIEKPWSGKRSPIAHADSRSACVTCFEGRRASANGSPETIRDRQPEPALQQQPALDQHVIGRDKRLTSREQCTGSFAGAIIVIGHRVKGRGIDESAQETIDPITLLCEMICSQ